jgi:hypothetical protein
VDPNLTESLALKNPNAYRARFKRLSLPQQAAHVERLAPSAYLRHCQAVGEPAAVRVSLSASATGLHSFSLEFGGLRVRKDEVTWADAGAQLRALLSGLPEGVSVEGSLMLSDDPGVAARVLGPGLDALGWKAREVVLSSDPSDGGRVRFAFATAVLVVTGTTGAGTFRGYAGVQTPERAAALESGWAALCGSLGVGWSRR